MYLSEVIKSIWFFLNNHVTPWGDERRFEAPAAFLYSKLVESVKFYSSCCWYKSIGMEFRESTMITMEMKRLTVRSHYGVSLTTEIDLTALPPKKTLDCNLWHYNSLQSLSWTFEIWSCHICELWSVIYQPVLFTRDQAETKILQLSIKEMREETMWHECLKTKVCKDWRSREDSCTFGYSDIWVLVTFLCSLQSFYFMYANSILMLFYTF